MPELGEMLVTENVTVNGVADAGEVAAGVSTEIVPVVAAAGTATLSDVAVTFVGFAFLCAATAWLSMNGGRRRRCRRRRWRSRRSLAAPAWVSR